MPERSGTNRVVATVLFAVLFAALIALGSPGHSQAQHTVINFDQLQKNIQAIRVKHNVPGTALVIVDDKGIVWSTGFGVADRDTEIAATPDTVFRIGSLTKIFTATALVQLARRDDFSLEDELTDHVSPELFSNPWRRAQPLTVAHLLEHTSGFRDWSKAEFDHNDTTPASLEDGLALSLESRTARWKPGMHSVYSNANYGLAGLVLERVAAQNYEEVLRKNLFEPLDMRSATTLPEHTTGLATGYGQNGYSTLPYWNMIQRPAAAINATPQDMAALVIMLLNHGVYRGTPVLSALEVERIETPTTSLAARNGLVFGYGLGIYQYYQNGLLFFGHSGDGDGYLSRFGYSRDIGLGYFVVINSAHHDALEEMQMAIEDEISQGHEVPAAPAPAVLDEFLLHHYSGHYVLAAWRFAWETHNSIRRRSLDLRPDPDGGLRIEYNDGDYSTLIPVNQHEFRRSYEKEATSGFFEDDGQLYFQESGNWVKVDDNSATGGN